MKKGLLANGWTQQLVRIKADYHNLYTFLSYKGSVGGETKTFFNTIFLYSLDSIVKDGFHYRVERFKGTREPKGFLIEETTANLAKEYFDFYSNIYFKDTNKKLTYAEFIEILLFIYCSGMLSEEDKKHLNIEWGVIDTSCK